MYLSWFRFDQDLAYRYYYYTSLNYSDENVFDLRLKNRCENN